MDWEKVATVLAEDYVKSFGCPADASHTREGLRCYGKKECPYADVDQATMAIDCWMTWAQGKVE